MNTFNLNLDLDKRGGVAQWVTLRQGDRRGTELRATIYDHGTQAGGGYTCRVSIRLPGAGDEYYRETATYTNGVAVVTVDEEYAAAIVGVTEGYFELLQGDAVIASTESFGVRILRSAQDGAVPGDKYDSAIEDALAELDEATGRISQMVVDATEEYLEAHPELTTTVEDNSLEDIKLIQHGGILDRVARLWHRLDNLLTATPAEADALTVTDAAKTPMAGLALYGRSTQDGTPTPSAPVAIQSVEPNLYDSANEPERTHNGVTWTTSAAGIKAVGTASGISYIKGSPSALTDADMTFLPAGTYTVTNHDGATMAAWVYVGSVSSATQVREWSADASTTFTVPDGGGYFRISLRVASGTTVDTTYRVSLNAGSSAAAGFVPYGNVGLWTKRTSDATQQSVTPIPLQSHALRSLPDGTRDEVTVDQYGHAILTQRVGSVVLDGSGSGKWVTGVTTYSPNLRCSISPSGQKNVAYGERLNMFCDMLTVSADPVSQPQSGAYAIEMYANYMFFTLPISAISAATVVGANDWLVAHPVTVQYPLATPVTIDLGTIDPVALQGPDMTAQAVPTAPFALTYERDLNVTLSRLEAAIADAATA